MACENPESYVFFVGVLCVKECDFSPLFSIRTASVCGSHALLSIYGPLMLAWVLSLEPWLVLPHPHQRGFDSVGMGSG